MNATQLDQFERFWRTYPRRIGKGAARKSFEKSLKLASFEEIMAGLQRQLSYYATKEQQFIPHPTTWLNQERWADEPQVPQRHQHRPGDMASYTRSLMDSYHANTAMDAPGNGSTQYALDYVASEKRH